MDRVCAPPLIRGTEFEILHDPVTNTTERRFGTCGPRALASALSSALGETVTLQSVYTWMRTHKNAQGNYWCDETGASTTGSIAACAIAFGAVVLYSAYYNPWDWNSYLALLRQHAGINPIVFETSDGQALVDSITGDGENATNLQYHFPSILTYHAGGASDYFGGRTLPEGFGTADGDNFAGGNSSANNFNATDTLQFYPVSVIEASKPVGLVVLKGRDVTLNISQVSGYFTANSDGSWHSKSTGKDIRGGILQFYQNFASPSGNLNGFSDLGLPLTDEIDSGTPKQGSASIPTIQVFERGALRYDPDRVADNPPGSTQSIYKAHLNAKEVLAVLSPPAPAPVPAPPAKVTFGTPTVESTESSGEVVITVTQPFSTGG